MGVSKAAVEIALCVERRVLPTQALLGSKSGQRKHTEKPHHALITHEVHSKLLLLSTLKLSERNDRHILLCDARLEAGFEIPCPSSAR